MKKIISIICVLAMMLSLAITVNAADKEVTFELVEQDETKAVYNINVETTETITSITTYFDGADAEAKGAIVTVAAVKGTACKYQRKTIMANFIPSDVATLTGKTTVTFDMTNVTESFNISAVDATGKRFQVTVKDTNGGADIDATANYSHATNATIAPYVAPKTEETDTLEAATDITIDGQKWTGIALYEASFNLNDIDAAKGYGIRVGETGKVTSTVAGTGTVDFVLAYYGDAAANVGTVQSFWTAK